MNYLPDLRSSLVAAAERAAEAPAEDPPVSGATRPRRWPMAGLRSIPVALGVVVAVGIAVLALTQIRHRSTTHRTVPTTTHAIAGRQALLDTLGVLRRPQAPADLDSRVLSRELGTPDPFAGRPDRALIRRATTTPWGSPVFIVPTFAPSTARIRAAFPGQHMPAKLVRALTRTGETVTEVDASGAAGRSSAAGIRAGDALTIEGAGRSFAGGSTQTRLVVIVPDGVAWIAFVVPRQVDPSSLSAPIYPHSLTADAMVHSNVAAVQVPREVVNGQAPMIWYAADGNVVKRIGNLAAVNRVVPPPNPGPETAQSRAAERDPSTPDRVWVTPAAGGPDAHYTLHFRILLNDADYAFHVSGTRCSQVTVLGGQGSGTRDIRGRIFAANLDAVQGQTWCPGTYRVSVSVMDLGRAGTLNHTAKPFGTTTFTVRR